MTMTPYRRMLTRMLHELETQAERRQLRTRDLASPLEAMHLVAYRSFGTRELAYVAGRLLGGTAAPPPLERAGAFRSLAAVYRSFVTRELPGIALEVSWHDRVAPVITDEEGYFRAALPLHGIAADTVSIEVTVRVVDSRVGNRAIETKAEVILPGAKSEFLVISDLDDTVIETNVTARMRMLQTVLLRNAHTRAATPGMSNFLRALHGGSDGTRSNPLFYVSGGPWNLYTLYRDFLDLQRFPLGAIMLADFGIDAETLIHPEHDVHKPQRIRQIIETYPALPLVLIGDSGERDPSIYRDLALEHPGRVAAIYIRHVEGASVVDATAEVPIVMFSDSTDAWKDAAMRGLAAPADGAKIS